MGLFGRERADSWQCQEMRRRFRCVSHGRRILSQEKLVNGLSEIDGLSETDAFSETDGLADTEGPSNHVFLMSEGLSCKPSVVVFVLWRTSVRLIVFTVCF